MTLNYEDAAIGMDELAADIITLMRRMGAFVKTLRPEWQDKFNAITELRSIDSPAADALKKLADEIYESGEHAP